VPQAEKRIEKRTVALSAPSAAAGTTDQAGA
jgi:hypothetical protein